MGNVWQRTVPESSPPLRFSDSADTVASSTVSKSCQAEGNEPCPVRDFAAIIGGSFRRYRQFPSMPSEHQLVLDAFGLLVVEGREVGVGG
jgi:hypothetical protein